MENQKHDKLGMWVHNPKQTLTNMSKAKIENSTDLVSAATKVSEKIKAGTVKPHSRASKVQELLGLRDTLLEWQRIGLRAPGIAEALAAEGYTASVVTVRRALKLVGKKKASKNPEAKAEAKPAEQQKAQTETKAKQNQKEATAPAQPQRQLTADEIAEKLKDTE